jgi:hypothetical protein
MKLRHAAALALTGWYLMIPPAPGTKSVPPLSKWVRLHEFVTAAQCEQAMEENQHPESGTLFISPSGKAYTPSDTDMEQPPMKCVASDDPRLKPK